MQETKYIITIYEYNAKEGGFTSTLTETVYTDINTSIKELFKQLMESKNLINKFFMVEVLNDKKLYTFYKIRVNNKGSIEDIHIISPNDLDKDMLIDAIIGNEISIKFAVSCTDVVIKKCINLENNEFSWKEDTRQRLQKVNILRLKEIYTKLKKS